MRRRASVRGSRDPRTALPTGIVALLPMLRRGAVTTEEFLRRTRADFERLAAALRRRHGGDRGKRAWPADVEVQDVANRMRLLAVEGVAKWDPTRGVSLAGFVLYRCESKVLRWTNQRRGARRATDPSRAPERVADALPGGEDERDVDRVSRYLAERAAAGCAAQEGDAAMGDVLAVLRAAGVVAVGVTVEDAVGAFEASKGLRELARRALFTAPLEAGDRSRVAGLSRPEEVLRWS